MKILLLTTTLLLFLLHTSGVCAQTSTTNKEKAKALIEQAQSYASEQEFGSAAQYLQEAYDLSPNLLDCKAIQLLGFSYYMMEETPLAIKFLELSAKCESNQETLARIYTHLGYSYDEMGNYKLAVENSEKAVSNSTSNEEISTIYEDLAHIHLDNENGDKTIESMQKSVAHYLKHLSIKESKVMQGIVIDETLGKKYFDLSWFAMELKYESVLLDAVVKSALCGNKDAISYCKDHNIAYRDAIVLPTTTTKEDEAATALIDEATLHASKQKYTSVISKLKKAHKISPAMFDGKVYHLMGLSYFKIKKYPSAIQHLEQALQFNVTKKYLHLIYGTLGDAYYNIKDYSKALMNAERALYLTDGDDDVLKSSLRLASIYLAKKDYNGTIDSYQNAIRYYMKLHTITDKEVMKDNVKDVFLAETHMKLTILLNKMKRGEEADNHLVKAALCGSEYAIEALEKNEVVFE